MGRYALRSASAPPPRDHLRRANTNAKLTHPESRPDREITTHECSERTVGRSSAAGGLDARGSSPSPDLLAALFCALMIPFCVSAQGAGICRHCCIPPECCTPALCNLGQESLELLQKIHDEVEAAGQLNNWIAFGNAITCMENGGIGCDPEAAVRAMGAVPAILKGQIDTDVITFLARNPHLPSDDRMYWENYEKNLHTPPTTTK